MKRALFLLATVCLLAFAASAAGATPIVNVTDHAKNLTETRYEPNACLGGAWGTVTVTYAAVSHTSMFADGTRHVDYGETGTFFTVMDDPSLPDYSGHFSNHFSFNGSDLQFAFTLAFKGIGEGTDGSRLTFHGTQHITVNADGDFTVNFDKLTCGS